MAIDGFIPAKTDHSFRHPSLDHKVCNRISRRTRTPAAVRKEPVIRRRINGIDEAQQFQDILNGPITNGQNSGDRDKNHPSRGRGLTKRHYQTRQQRFKLLGHTNLGGFLVQVSVCDNSQT
jgi:hypothetical protein